jgi:5-methyltetrahydrofolate--homocysteine methyltransferase
MPEPAALYDAIIRGDRKAAVEITEAALKAGAGPVELVDGSMIPAMDEVGRRFENEEYFVPELLLSGRAMKSALELLRPLLAARGVEPIGTVVIGTVQGDLHDIGKNLVAAMLEGAGFRIVDVGVDVAPAKFIKAIQTTNATIVAVSALLTVTMPAIRTTIDAIREAGLRGQVKIMIGGAPVTRLYAEEVGADGYSESATGAVPLARTLLAEAAACR